MAHVSFQACAMVRLTHLILRFTKKGKKTKTFQRKNHDSLCTQHLKATLLLIQAYKLDAKMLSRNYLNQNFGGCSCFDPVSTLLQSRQPPAFLESLLTQLDSFFFFFVKLRISIKTRCVVWSKLSWENKCSLCSVHLVIIHQTIFNGNAFTGHLVKIRSHFS